MRRHFSTRPGRLRGWPQRRGDAAARGAQGRLMANLGRFEDRSQRTEALLAYFASQAPTGVAPSVRTAGPRGGPGRSAETSRLKQLSNYLDKNGGFPGTRASATGREVVEGSARDSQEGSPALLRWCSPLPLAASMAPTDRPWPARSGRREQLCVATVEGFPRAGIGGSGAVALGRALRGPSAPRR
jgi:hypothetical protein